MGKQPADKRAYKNTISQKFPQQIKTDYPFTRGTIQSFNQNEDFTKSVPQSLPHVLKIGGKLLPIALESITLSKIENETHVTFEKKIYKRNFKRTIVPLLMNEQNETLEETSELVEEPATLTHINTIAIPPNCLTQEVFLLAFRNININADSDKYSLSLYNHNGRKHTFNIPENTKVKKFFLDYIDSLKKYTLLYLLIHEKASKYELFIYDCTKFATDQNNQPELLETKIFTSDSGYTVDLITVNNGTFSIAEHQQHLSMETDYTTSFKKQKRKKILFLIGTVGIVGLIAYLLFVHKPMPK